MPLCQRLLLFGNVHPQAVWFVCCVSQLGQTRCFLASLRGMEFGVYCQNNCDFFFCWTMMSSIGWSDCLSQFSKVGDWVKRRFAIFMQLYTNHRRSCLSWCVCCLVFYPNLFLLFLKCLCCFVDKHGGLHEWSPFHFPLWEGLFCKIGWW